MTLPKIETPRYTLTLPSSGKQIEYRPFLVKEQKALLIAMESPEDGAVESTTLSVVQACLFDKVDVRKLPKVDVDYIFIKLRAKSVGEQIDLIVQCKECGNNQDYVFNLDDVMVERTEGHTANIKISDSVGIVMRLPTFAEVAALTDDYTVDNIYKTVIACIEQIYDEETLYLTKDMPKEDVAAWVDNLNQEQYEKLEMFYRTVPKIVSKLEYKCNKCESINQILLEGIEDFFE